MPNIGNWKHGKTGTPEYIAWEGIMQRCYNPNCKSFKNYGARGVIVCDRWHDPDNFISDMGLRPSPKHSLERIDNNGNYEPNNCQWKLFKYQNRNRRTTKMSMAKVEEARWLWQHTGLTQKEIARKFGIESQGYMSEILSHRYWKEGK